MFFASITACRAWLLAVAAVSLLSCSAFAQQNIGSAAVVLKDVTRSIGGQRGTLSTGESVFRDETVKTGSASSTKLVFVDSTNLAVGPVSRVVLDRFVFAGNQTSAAVGVKLAQGLFRFTTGSLDKRAYTITTPSAVLGVRGTIFDVGVEGSRRTRVTLVEGEVLVCPRRPEAGRKCADPIRAPATIQEECGCVTLDRTGQTASVTTIAGIRRAELTLDSVSFAPLCAAAAGLCSASQYAQVNRRFSRDARGPDGRPPGADARGPVQTAASEASAALCGR